MPRPMKTITQEEAIAYCVQNYNNLSYRDVGRPLEETGDKMVEAFQRLGTLKAVAEEFGCTICNVQRRLKCRGVKMNPRGRKAGTKIKVQEQVSEQVLA